jgi:tetratricopeptide (TPR) repeat protein
MATPPRVSLSACLIVRDEAAMLDACLQSLDGVDELVVVDTGSTDGTVAIAERFGARIGHTPWTDDFAAARNVSLDMATGDWILVIDADQRLVGGVDAVRSSILALGTERNLLFPVIRNLTAAGEPVSSYRSGQVFQRRPERRYVGRIHEYIADGRQPLAAVWVSGWHFDHLGFTPALRADRAKAARNLALLHRWLDESPDDADAWYYLGVEQQMAGQLPEALAAYEKGLAAVPGVVETSLLRLNLLGVWESLGDWATVLDRAIAWRMDGELFPDYWLIAGRAALRTGRFALAGEWFRQAAAFGPERPVAYETAGARTWKPAAYQALLAAETNDWEAVRQLLAPWKSLLGRDPFLTRLYLHAGLVGPDPTAVVGAVADLLTETLAVPVLDALDEVLQRFPALKAALASRLAGSPGGRWLLARECQRQADWSGLEKWARSEGLPPAGAALLAGWAAFGLRRWEDAEAQAAEACRAAPDLAEAWALRGDIAAAAGQEAAWGHWHQALSAGAPAGPVLETMARHALATADAQRAGELLQPLRQLDPLHPLLWPLGDLLRRSGSAG